MGSIQSVSLPSGITCKVCGCNQKCYAKRIERRRKSVREAYQNNLSILNTEPETYWREVEAAIMLSRYFRFHVSGDIPDALYFFKMVEVAKRNPHCEILCFTKKYEIVNDYLAVGNILPDNLHILFSAWVGLTMTNPIFFTRSPCALQGWFYNPPTKTQRNAVAIVQSVPLQTMAAGH